MKSILAQCGVLNFEIVWDHHICLDVAINRSMVNHFGSTTLWWIGSDFEDSMVGKQNGLSNLSTVKCHWYATGWSSDRAHTNAIFPHSGRENKMDYTVQFDHCQMPLICNGLVIERTLIRFFLIWGNKMDYYPVYPLTNTIDMRSSDRAHIYNFFPLCSLWSKWMFKLTFIFEKSYLFNKKKSLEMETKVDSEF